MIRFLQSGNKAAKYILGGFLSILVVSMAAYLIPGFMSNVDASNRNGVLASVAGEEIRTEQVSKLVQQQMRAQGQRVPDFYMPILMQQAVQQLVQTQEVRYAAERLGLKVSDQEIRDELQNGPDKQYFFPGGKWVGQKEYVDMLARAGLTPETYEAQTRDRLLARKLFNTVAAGVSATPAEVEQEYKNKNLKVKFKYALLNLDDIQKEIKPTDADLKAFYQANQLRYKNAVPEKRRLRYFVLLDKDAESKVVVSPAEIQAFYTAHVDQYRMPERVKVRHIQIKVPAPGPDGQPDRKAVDAARAKAADIAKQLKGGADFAGLAKKYSEDTLTAQNGGEIGWIQKGQFPSPETEKAAFSQEKGQFSAPVETPLGFDIIQTVEKEQARIKPLSEVKDQIEKELKAQKVSDVVQNRASAAQETAQKQGLDKAAAQAGVQVVESNPVSRTDSLPGVGPAPEVMGALFAAQEKAPDMQRFNQGFVVYEVAGIIPARTPAFDEIKDRVATDFKADRARELLEKRAQQLADRAHAEHDLEKAAKEFRATVKTSELVGRTSQVPEIGSLSGAASTVFALKPGEISGPINLGQKMAVAALIDRQEASATDPQFAQERDSLKEQIDSQKKQQALELFMSNLTKQLEAEHKVKFNKTEMDRLAKGRG
ncbi:MAG TPA: peptidyl-prolyl cis-trans isomerase [Candidatus Angelobacter sp.]|nr:peptidyl-prolyl cis-trans isomerase [Candidatus Angelobacter sp.]